MRKASVILNTKIKTVFEGGYSWVSIPDQLWKEAQFQDYIAGIPLWMKR